MRRRPPEPGAGGPSILSHHTLSLAGTWRLRLDPNDEGLSANWAGAPLETSDAIVLPGTTDLAGFGFPLDAKSMRHRVVYPPTTLFPGVPEPARADSCGHLVRRFWFVGPAWYERVIVIPKSWSRGTVTLTIERALWKSSLWLDGRSAGSCDSLVAPHCFVLGMLSPGKHRLTMCVDNRMIHNITTVTHAYGPETQSQWNGMIGAIRLQCRPAVSVNRVVTYPAVDRFSLKSVVEIANDSSDAFSGMVRATVFPEAGEKCLGTATVKVESKPGTHAHEIVVRFAERARPWDEFHPARYRVEVALHQAGPVLHRSTGWFGFRTVQRAGRKLTLNSRALFLRGTLDCCVHPNTGHPPMSVAGWARVLRTIKKHGFNHVRFHTWCPPDAAFAAADRLGIYLQAETPGWVDDWGPQTSTHPQGLGRDPRVLDYLRRELRRMSVAYGNHPSFLFCSIGNEFGDRQTDWPAINRVVEEIKSLDPRRLYAGCAARRHLPADDFWVTHDSGAPTRGVGPAGTDWDFSEALKSSPVPLIAHETGQRPVFPDYETLLPKFDGPLLPLNLQRLRRGLLENSLSHQLPQFVEASARFQFTQYKAEHEAMLRTRGYAGYQLLMLNDFTGQSEALVGLLDPFWQSKGVITPKDVRAWNAPTVVLARFPKFVWSATETFRASIDLAHFGPGEHLRGRVDWSLTTSAGRGVARGVLPEIAVTPGKVSRLGRIRVSLREFWQPAALRLTVRFADVANEWNLWVYPSAPAAPAPEGVLVTHVFDKAALRTLEDGGRVLFLAHGLQNAHTATTGFESVYWSAGWWGNRFSSLGTRCDPSHPALAQFPTAPWCDWQWRDLREGATTFDLAGAPKRYQPIIQPVPDFHYNALLGQLFEARVGEGSLLVCGFDLENNLGIRLAASQFRRSLFEYAASAAFRPRKQVSVGWVKDLLTSK